MDRSNRGAHAASDRLVDIEAAAPSRRRCLHFTVTGQVQGVGFRPYIYRLAQDCRLGGWVRNSGAGAEITIMGTARQIDAFRRRLPRELPALARIEHITENPIPVEHGVFADAFRILQSCGGTVTAPVTPDAAVCVSCLKECFDRHDRRYRHAFISCTQCGPRFSITHRLPYDRPFTTMADFAMCPACHKEYQAPDNRRFHAQTNACPDCGPQLSLQDALGARVPGDPVATGVSLLRDGHILAVKGIGGFHLLCDARNRRGVARLRARKQREEKPFALMALNTRSLADRVECSEAEQQWLDSSTRPIVLLRKTHCVHGDLPGVADGLAWLGVLLPYSPLHYLFFHEYQNRPQGTAWLQQPCDLLLVATSANPNGEPIVKDNEQALLRLRGMADYFLLHDRAIHVHCDDSVLQIRESAPLLSSSRTSWIRRARGITPQAVELSSDGPPVLATGAYYKNTVCLTRDNKAYLSQHIGSLHSISNRRHMDFIVQHMLDVLGIEPRCVAHDLHPDFYSSRFAAQFAAERGIAAIGVQHHVAHVAAVCAEHGLHARVLGAALDGTGLGTDNTGWGGELLLLHQTRWQRVGRLRPLPMPGGDAAAREPWRMAAAVMHLLGQSSRIVKCFPYPAAATVAAMLESDTHCPPTSSAGRWFDAVAALLHIKHRMHYEAQAAMLLQSLALRYTAAIAPPPEVFMSYRTLPPPPGSTRGNDARANGTNTVLELNVLPLVEPLLSDKNPVRAARRFHTYFSYALANWIAEAAQRHRAEHVVLSGGCFANTLLAQGVMHFLRERLPPPIDVHTACRVPVNDGGIALGQAWYAMQWKPDANATEPGP